MCNFLPLHVPKRRTRGFVSLLHIITPSFFICAKITTLFKDYYRNNPVLVTSNNSAPSFGQCPRMGLKSESQIKISRNSHSTNCTGQLPINKQSSHYKFPVSVSNLNLKSTDSCSEIVILCQYQLE